MKLVFASNNAHKLDEVRKILPADIEVVSLAQIGFHSEIDETGTTLEANSLIKAETIHDWLKQHPEVEADGIFADDTGLEIDALGGAPGVYTARWAGEDCIAANNRAKALSELNGITNRHARFRTVVTLIRGEKTEQVDGVVNGDIAEKEYGDGGFGYDPVFIPEGYDKTFAELPAEVKNSISHRARAMEALRRILALLLIILAPLGLRAEDEDVSYGVMGQWSIHSSYSNTSQVALADDQVFALSAGSLFSVDKKSELITTWNKANYLSDDNITHIGFDPVTHQLVVLYSDGLIDLIRDGRVIATMNDLYLKEKDMTIVVNSMQVKDGMAYLGTSFGVVQINLHRREIAGSYYIGNNGAAENIQDVDVLGDTIYAATSNRILCASRHRVLEDYTNWHELPLPGTVSAIMQMQVFQSSLMMLADNTLYAYSNGAWSKRDATHRLNWIRATTDCLFGYSNMQELLAYQDQETIVADEKYNMYDAAYEQGTYWIAGDTRGLVRRHNGHATNYLPEGPYSTVVNAMQFVDEKLFVAGGGRWAVFYNHPAHVITYEKGEWNVIHSQELSKAFGITGEDLMYYAVDPMDKTHFYATLYGNGLVEYRQNKPYRLFNCNTPGCTLKSALDNDPNYMFLNGISLDSKGNLWVLADRVSPPINILTPNGQWVGLNMGTSTLRTNGGLLIDNRHPNWKWTIDCRLFGVYLYDDHGTPTDASDDRYCKRSSFVDQKGNVVSPQLLYCMAQDRNGAIWFGTDAGVFVIEHEDFFNSNACTRPLIPRNDGTILADYLLSTEQINAIAVDGANRKWIGTAKSGIYLVSADGLETIHHFTAENSNLPSSEILCIAINSETGDVYVGTAAGIASYRSDATNPKEDMSSVYAYPNPVYPNYVGEIAVTGLMEDSWVNIVDEGGNLVCKTRSYGGTATWDGCDQSGRRVATGVYSALCNAGDGSGHTVVKILIMH